MGDPDVVPGAELLCTPRLVPEPLRPLHAAEMAVLLDDLALNEFTGGAAVA